MIHVYPDYNIQNADWTKQTQDVFIEAKDGALRPVKNIAELKKTTGMSSSELKKLPVRNPAPKRKREDENA